VCGCLGVCVCVRVRKGLWVKGLGVRVWGLVTLVCVCVCVGA